MLTCVELILRIVICFITINTMVDYACFDISVLILRNPSWLKRHLYYLNMQKNIFHIYSLLKPYLRPKPIPHTISKEVWFEAFHRYYYKRITCNQNNGWLLITHDNSVTCQWLQLITITDYENVSCRSVLSLVKEIDSNIFDWFDFTIFAIDHLSTKNPAWIILSKGF